MSNTLALFLRAFPNTTDDVAAADDDDVPHSALFATDSQARSSRGLEARSRLGAVRRRSKR